MQESRRESHNNVPLRLLKPKSMFEGSGCKEQSCAFSLFTEEWSARVGSLVCPLRAALSRHLSAENIWIGILHENVKDTPTLERVSVLIVVRKETGIGLQPHRALWLAVFLSHYTEALRMCMERDQRPQEIARLCTNKIGRHWTGLFSRYFDELIRFTM